MTVRHEGQCGYIVPGQTGYNVPSLSGQTGYIVRGCPGTMRGVLVLIAPTEKIKYKKKSQIGETFFSKLQRERERDLLNPYFLVIQPLIYKDYGKSKGRNTNFVYKV